MLLKAVDRVLGLRVTIEEEHLGLDHSQHKEASHVFDHQPEPVSAIAK